MSLPKQRSMTVAVVAGALVVPDALLAVGFTRDDRLDFLVFEEGAKRIGVIAFAGQEVLDAGDQADHSCAMTQSAVCPASRSTPRAEKRIDDRVAVQPWGVISG